MFYLDAREIEFPVEMDWKIEGFFLFNETSYVDQEYNQLLNIHLCEFFFFAAATAVVAAVVVVVFVFVVVSGGVVVFALTNHAEQLMHKA